MNFYENNKAEGIVCSKGIGIGNVVFVEKNDINFDAVRPENAQDEVERYKNALSEFIDRTSKFADELESSLGKEDAEILRSHIALAKDPELDSLIVKMIMSGKCAEAAVSSVCNIFSKMFAGIEDEVIKQKSLDIIDVKRQLLGVLLGSEEDAGFEKGSVIASKDIEPSLVAVLSPDNISAIITENGNENSHSAILARALRIPFVSGIRNIEERLLSGHRVIVDGFEGKVYINPNSELIHSFEEKKQKAKDKELEYETFRGKKTLTSDSKGISLMCNASGLVDLRNAIENDCEGIGLFRTELIYMRSDHAPTEEEQFNLYQKAAQLLDGKTLTIRTLDIGGDKNIPYLKMKEESNPFLGIRAIRYCLKENPELFKTQVRAILRASAFGNIRIMLPMISDVSEAMDAKALIGEVKESLRREGIPFDNDIKTGCMIETPSAAVISDILAKHFDFFSIGTNDLTGYVMCSDRGNSETAYLYSVCQPAVLRLVEKTAKSACDAGIPVGICGEAAGDDRLLPLFLDYGITGLSISPGEVLEKRMLISRLSREKACDIAEKVNKFDTAEEITAYLNNLRSENG